MNAKIVTDCQQINPTFVHQVLEIEGGLLFSSSAQIHEETRVMETPLPAERASQRDAVEFYHLGECLRTLKGALNGAALAKHVPGALPAEEAGQPAS